MSTPLHEFEKLNDFVSLYRVLNHDKKTRSQTTSPSSPSLILFCSWVGAAPKHIAKYTNGYKDVFPHASILLVQSKVSSMFAQSDISPAFDTLNSFTGSDTRVTDQPKASIVLHAFSNGGANNAVLLATHFRKQGGYLPLDRIILDCCPGRPEASAIARAITLSMPNHYLLRTTSYYFFLVAMAIFALVVRTLGVEDIITRIRRTLTDPMVFSKCTPRLYLYSKADTMVRFEDVHQHAEDARENGYESIREEVFESAAHCALLNEDSKRYWKIVSDPILADSSL